MLRFCLHLSFTAGFVMLNHISQFVLFCFLADFKKKQAVGQIYWISWRR